MRKSRERVLKPKPKRKRNIFDDIKKGKNLKKVFKKESNRRTHLKRLKVDKGYYAANFKYRREKYKKK